MSLTKKIEVGEKDFERIKAVKDNEGRYAIIRDFHYKGVLVGRIQNKENNFSDYLLHPPVGEPINLEYHDLTEMEIILGEINSFGDIRR